MGDNNLELGIIPSVEPRTNLQPHLVVGYPHLAGRMSTIPETAMFRQFSALAAEDLLHRQAELIRLETKYRKSQLEDSQSQEERRRKYAVSWFWFDASARDNEPGDAAAESNALMTEIRVRLKDYQKALIRSAAVAGFPEPSSFDLAHLQCFLESDEGLKFALIGSDKDTWGTSRAPYLRSPDLIALKARHNEDAFSKWVTSGFMERFFACRGHRSRKPSPIYGIVAYDESKLLRITYWITSVLASLLPIASITVLYYVKPTLVRLALIAIFNVTVSICLTGFTTARRADIFAITAAYKFAAVQVVFVSSNSNGGTCSSVQATPGH